MPRRLAVHIAIMAAALWLVAPGRAQAQNAVPTQTIDPFGQEVTLSAKTIVYVTGTANWDTAFETLIDAFKTVQAYAGKAGLKPAGPVLTIYTQTSDTGFEFQAALPVMEPPKAKPPGKLAVGTSPEGKMFKFVHRGSYDGLNAIYEAITNFLDDKDLEAKDLFVEEYVTDPLKTLDDKLVINVYVPVK